MSWNHGGLKIGDENIKRIKTWLLYTGILFSLTWRYLKRLVEILQYIQIHTTQPIKVLRGI